MKIRKSVLAHAAFAAATIGAVTFAMQADATKDADRYIPERDMPMMDMEQGMVKWQESVKLGKPHTFFKDYVGEWNTTTRLWMAGPDAAPTEEAGTAKFELLMGGRYLKQTWSGTMMGMPVEGIGYNGFDNNRKLFVSIWMDTMSTGFLKITGNLSKDGRMLTQVGEMDEVMTGEIGKPVKWVTTWIGEDHFTFRGVEILYGEDMTVFEIEYKRKK